MTAKQIMKNQQAIRWVATCGAGIEPWLAEEAIALGGVVETQQPGAVIVNADLEWGYKACLWSRLAERILMPLAAFKAQTPDDIYYHCKKIAWMEHMEIDRFFAVNVVVHESVPHNPKFVTLRLKDAIVDVMRNATGERPSVDSHRPDIVFSLYWKGEDAQIYLDFSGEPLHRRGYRTEAGEAPLKETLAAAMLKIAGWPSAQLTALLDPFCGSGTLLIEGALMALGIAPGLDRPWFGFFGWRQAQRALWEPMVNAARQHRDEVLKGDNITIDGVAAKTPRLVGYDADRDVVAVARANLQRAGLEKIIHIERRELALFDEKHVPEGVGLLLTNPPYGERISDREAAPWLYESLAAKLGRYCVGWQCGILAAQVEDADRIAVENPKVQRLHNGPIRVYLRCGTVKPVSARTVRLPAIKGEGGVPDFANRLTKNLKKLRKWIESEQPMCLRLYDADMPEYNVAVDWYNGDIHLQEYAPPKSIDPEKAQQRLQAVQDTLCQVLGVNPRFVHVKSRRRQKGRDQYQKLGEQKHFLQVEEGAARLLVNLDDYLDTGLFLDHRPIRLRLEELCRGKRFLNLFCYTAAATAHAGVGGCRSSVSVDASRTYLEWASKNFALNGMAECNHRLVQADCMRWLQETREQFDVIFVDPPTFSNNKSRNDFDVQSDQVKLIDLAMRRLERDGVLIFSNNFRKFQLDETLVGDYDVKEITASTLSPDFSVEEPIHRCWEIRFQS